MRAFLSLRRVLIPLLLILSFLYVPCQAQEKISVSAASAVLMEAESGNVLYEKDAHTKRKMASTTKIMTAYVALCHCPLERIVTVDARAVGTEGSSAYLRAGEQIRMEDLLYALMLSSANDAAAAIAYAICDDIEAFADLMNQQAKEWGLMQTHFENPHGLDAPQHYTTATELAQIARNALQNEDFARIVATKRHTSSRIDAAGERVFVNHNRLLHAYPGTIGVKTGFTKKSGRCLVSAAEKDGVRMIAVTLDAPNDWQDHRAMLDQGFFRYEHRCVVQEGEISFAMPVVGGELQTVILQNRDSLFATVPKSTSEMRIVLEGQRFFFAPIAKDQPLAVAKIYNKDQYLGEVTLYACTDVALQTPPSRWRLPWKY